MVHCSGLGPPVERSWTKNYGCYQKASYYPELLGRKHNSPQHGAREPTKLQRRSMGRRERVRPARIVTLYVDELPRRGG